MGKKPDYSKIVISGKICTGKSTLVHHLSEKLGWKTFSSGQYFRKYAQEHNLVLENAEEQNETITKQVDYLIREQLITEPHLIVDAWMGGIMAENIPKVLKILLTCKEEERFNRFAEREKVSHEEAKRRVLQRENHVLAKIKKIHGRDDIFAPNHYNMVIDTTGKDPQEILQEVLEQLT